MARFSLIKPTQFGTAVVVTIISAAIIFILAEVVLNVYEDFGGVIEMPYIILSIVFFGTVVAWAILMLLMRRKIIILRKN